MTRRKKKRIVQIGFVVLTLMLVGWSVVARADNVTSGISAGNSILSGYADYNILIGQGAGYRLTSGDYNIKIGFFADQADSSNSNRFVVQRYPYTPLLFGDLVNGRLSVNYTSAGTYTFYVGGTLGVSGATTLGGTLTIGGDLTFENAETISNSTDGIFVVTADTIKAVGVLVDQSMAINDADSNDLTLLAERSGELVVITNKTGVSDRTLPEAVPGLYYEFYICRTDSGRINVASGDSLIAADGTGYVTQTTVAGTLKLVARDTVRWVMLFPTGTWTGY